MSNLDDDRRPECALEFQRSAERVQIEASIGLIQTRIRNMLEAVSDGAAVAYPRIKACTRSELEVPTDIQLPKPTL